jgi:hypothetical protein
MRLFLYARRPAELAARITGAKLTIMSKLGHFPRSEDPALFLTYLRPVLEEIRASAG